MSTYDVTSPMNPTEHVAGCPVATPWLYSVDEYPLECICDEVKAEDRAVMDSLTWVDGDWR